MKCPKCGEEMPEESLYCEHCGEDIHIVPDFEPELERNIEQNINSILEELYEKDGAGQEETERDEPNEVSIKVSIKSSSTKLFKLRKWQWALIFGNIFAVAAVWAAWSLYSYNSEEYQADRGAYYTRTAKYDRAISCYNRALELDSDNIDLMFSLAEVYLLKNNKIEYEYLLRDIVRNPAASTEQLESAYGKLIAIYRAREDYQTINDLLLSCDSDLILSIYQNYIARTPEFSIKEGYYASIQPLSLTAFGTGKIYYTMDGTEPTENSAAYTAPIILEKGDYVISAYFVNDKGIASDIVTKEYHIEIEEIPAPDVSVPSGKYSSPINIEVKGEEGEIYYTTDGTDPTYSSSAYKGPIPMPLGRSFFKFAQIANGVTGLITERNYQLEMNTNYTPEQAVAAIRDYALETAKIYDEAGHFDESGAVYQYQYQYVMNINGINDFYVIAEFLCSSSGTAAKTGSNYAVNAYTGEFFRLEQDKYGNYSLIIIEKDRTLNNETGNGDTGVNGIRGNGTENNGTEKSEAGTDGVKEAGTEDSQEGNPGEESPDADDSGEGNSGADDLEEDDEE